MWPPSHGCAVLIWHLCTRKKTTPGASGVRAQIRSSTHRPGAVRKAAPTPITSRAIGSGSDASSSRPRQPHVVAGWMPSKGQAGAKCAQGRCKRGTTIKAARQGPHLTPCSLPRGRTCAQRKYREFETKSTSRLHQWPTRPLLPPQRGEPLRNGKASRLTPLHIPAQMGSTQSRICPSLDERLGVTSGWPVSKPGRMRPAGPAGDFAGFGIGGCSG